jgi:hypothetical protein
MEGASKQKKTIRRVKKASNSPIPSGPRGGFSVEDSNPTCGHHNCTGGKCNVRYVGPVTSLRDHHIMHAARGATHVWTAAIVAGLAVVLTGAIAYSAFGADVSSPTSMYDEFRQINTRLDKIEALLKTMTVKTETQKTEKTAEQPEAKGDRAKTTTSASGSESSPTTANDSASSQCLKTCVSDFNACYTKLGNRETCLYGNNKDVTGYQACRSKCSAS